MLVWLWVIGCGPRERRNAEDTRFVAACDEDNDDDGIGACRDNCPGYGNADQADADDDGIGDVCDDCTFTPSPGGVGDRCGCAPMPCTEGAAGVYPCDRVELVTFVSLEALGGRSTNDVWGWTDATGREYALVGLDNGVAFLDLGDPTCPVHVGNLPASGEDSQWRDLETWQDHLYVGSETEGHGVQVFDLHRLAEYAGEPLTFEADRVYDGVGNSHTITIDPVGGLLSANGSDTCDGGLHLVDLADPAEPVFAACTAPSVGYVHDAQCVTYHGPDADHVGAAICVAANGPSGRASVIDVTDPSHPVGISEIDYLAQGAIYAHQGWFTEDHAYFLFGDELDEDVRGVDTTTWVFDLRDLDQPVIVGSWANRTESIDHQQYVHDGRVYQSNYTTGLRILDLAGVATADLEEVGYFDVWPYDDDATFAGSWSNYPWFASGVLPVTSMDEGLFLLQPRLDP